MPGLTVSPFVRHPSTMTQHKDRHGYYAANTIVSLGLVHLNLSGKVVVISTRAICHGSSSEVFTGRCILPDRGEIEVAIKRLRFQVDSSDYREVRPSPSQYA